jgi:hypothetical protein
MSDTQENTRWVEVWIINDGDYHDRALELATDGDTDGLGEYLTESLKGAPEGSGAWHTAQEMSDADYGRVDWKEIAETLTAK